MTPARREAVVFGGATLAVLLVVVALFPVLLTRPLWLDEVHTQIVAGRATPAQVIGDVAAGIDTAPGLLHLVLWAVGLVAGLSPVVLHAVPFVLVWLAHVTVFVTLRRRFALVPSVAGVLAVATHALVIQMTYEARFYGPWLLLAAAFAWSLGLPPSRRRDAWIAVWSVLLCTIHWFGVISLGIMCVAAVVVHGRGWRRGLRLVMPAGAGLVALALTAPILLQQRAAVTAPSWIPAPSGPQIWVMARAFYVALVPAFALVMILAALLRPRVALPAPPPSAPAPSVSAESAASQPPATPPTPAGTLLQPDVAALLSLALMPVALLVVSYLLQPSLLDRYATVATLAWAPLVAFALRWLPARTAALFCVLLVGLGVMNYRRAIAGMDGYRRGLAAGVHAYRMAVERSDLPIVFQSRHVEFPIVAEERRGRERVVFLSLPDSTLEAIFPPGSHLRLMSPFFRFEREAALLHERVYGFPPTRTQAQLDSLPRFLLVGSDASLPPGYKHIERFALAVFPNHSVVRVDPELAVFTRRP